MGPSLVLVRNPTVARPVLQLLLLLLLRHATAARPVLLWLLLLPRHANAARCHIVIPSLDSDSHAPPRPDNHDRRQEHGGAMDVPGTGAE